MSTDFYELVEYATEVQIDRPFVGRTLWLAAASETPRDSRAEQWCLDRAWLCEDRSGGFDGRFTL